MIYIYLKITSITCAERVISGTPFSESTFSIRRFVLSCGGHWSPVEIEDALELLSKERFD